MAILKLRDENGNIIEIPAIKGDKGDKGDPGDKNAYLYAQEGGYTGTETEFAAKMAEDNPSQTEFDQLSQEVDELKEDLGDIDNDLNIVSRVPVVFEQGFIDDSGQDATSTTMIRSVGFLDMRIYSDITITVVDGFKCYAFYYNTDETFIAKYGITGTSHIKIALGDKSRLVIVKEGSTVNPDYTKPLDYISLSANKIRKYASTENITEVRNTLNNILYSIGLSGKYWFDAESGDYDSSGENNTNINSIRTSDYIDMRNSICGTLTLTNGYIANVCYYDANKTFIRMVNNTSVIDPCQYCKICVYSSDTDLYDAPIYERVDEYISVTINRENESSLNEYLTDDNAEWGL